jgi:tetratricopeptide (TPR) repeat protein
MNLEQSNFAKAVDNFTLSLKCDPRHVEAHYNLANLYYDAGDLRLARLHYETATLIEPGFSLVYFNLALVYHRLNEMSLAYAALEKYKQLEPNDEEIGAINQLLKAMEGRRLKIED